MEARASICKWDECPNDNVPKDPCIRVNKITCTQNKGLTCLFEFFFFFGWGGGGWVGGKKDTFIEW